MSKKINVNPLVSHESEQVGDESKIDKGSKSEREPIQLEDEPISDPDHSGDESKIDKGSESRIAGRRRNKYKKNRKKRKKP